MQLYVVKKNGKYAKAFWDGSYSNDINKAIQGIKKDWPKEMRPYLVPIEIRELPVAPKAPAKRKGGKKA